MQKNLTFRIPSFGIFCYTCRSVCIYNWHRLHDCLATVSQMAICRCFLSLLLLSKLSQKGDSSFVAAHAANYAAGLMRLHERRSEYMHSGEVTALLSIGFVG